MGYDSAGRPHLVTIARGTYTLAYDNATGNLQGITAPDNGTLTFSYDGFVPLTAIWAGTVAGSVRGAGEPDPRRRVDGRELPIPADRR